MRIGICDPDQRYIQWLDGLIRQIACVKDCRILPYRKPGWLLEDVTLGAEAFDMLIVSQCQKETTGVQILEQVHRYLPGCRGILLSQDNSVLPEAYQLAGCVLLPKTLVPLHLITVVQQLYGAVQRQQERYIRLVTGRERRILPASQVLYMEKVLRKTMVVTKTNSFETYQPPKELLESSGCTSFIQCHRSFYINLVNAQSLCPNYIRMEGEDMVPVGSTFSDSVREAFDAYYTRLLTPVPPRAAPGTENPPGR